MTTSAPVYTSTEVTAAVAFAAAIQITFFAVLIAAGAAEGMIQPQEPPPLAEKPIAVKPVIDDLPLLKLGGKRVRAKLPDMWKKQAPVKRFEALSAPSPDAEKTPEAIPESEVATFDAQAPPPDADLAKKVDELIDGGKEVPNLQEEGAADGVKEGTEKDPLKARAVNLYLQKLIGWFQARFRPPIGQLSCEELAGLSARVTVQVSGSRTVGSYTISRPSGNPIFDAKVKATMDGTVGDELPPPPPLYPDILGSTVTPTFSGKHPECK